MIGLHEECGVVAVYHLPGKDASHPVSPPCLSGDSNSVSQLIPRMLLDLQNRGQSAAGITTYNPEREQILMTHKEVGTVTEVFRLSNRPQFHRLMEQLSGQAAIGHVRYATKGQDDGRYAQPMERYHFRKQKWFSFAFNGELANHDELMGQLKKDASVHISQETDAEILLHEISLALSRQEHNALETVCQRLSRKLDGAYSLVFMNANGEMVVGRDPLGIKPLCYAVEGSLFAAASESVALFNLGFSPESIRDVAPGEVIHVSEQGIRKERFAESTRSAHCFFEWIYFANVASKIDGQAVYLARKRLGEELAARETVPIDEDTIVVPVPDTSKAAADGMAYALKVPCLEGLIRNRYSGRTFIEGGEYRKRKAETKYTPLTEVLEGKKVFLVEDSIVRSTTMRVLIHRIRSLGKASEIHVRVACPPIIAPCFYGVDMSTFDDIYATNFYRQNVGFSAEGEVDLSMVQNMKTDPDLRQKMAIDFGADSVEFLSREAASRAIGLDQCHLCLACATAQYPTDCATQAARIAFEQFMNPKSNDQ